MLALADVCTSALRAEAKTVNVEIIEGHACDLGKTKRTMLLPERAEAVATFLESKSIPLNLKVRSEGSLKPLSRSALEEKRAMNRRVEIVVYHYCGAGG